jgi:hypothetical protein
MQKLLCASAVSLMAMSALVGCSSSSSSSSSTVTVNVSSGQTDFKQADIWSIAITEGGYPNIDAEGRLVHSIHDTGDDAEARISIPTEELRQFNLVGHQASQQSDGLATSRVCQWASGCTLDGELVEFGSEYQVYGELWNLVVYSLGSDERVRITPFTSLAAGLAFDRLYEESSSEWLATGYFSAYSVEQSVSQLSQLLGIDNIQTSEPANLNELNRWNGNQAKSLDSIRYGALIAAFEELSRSYSGSQASLLTQVKLELIEADGQLVQSGGDQALSLASLYQAARDNLAAISVSNTTAAAYVATVVSQLDADISALIEDELTTVVPASLTDLFTESELEDFSLGLQRTKAFVQDVRNYQDTFFEDGYQEELDAYVAKLEAVGAEHSDNLNALMKAYLDTAQFYLDCATQGGCPSPDSDWDWLTSVDSYDSATKVLTLNSGQIRVSQEVADINETDSDDTPSQSQGIDIYITGTYEMGELILILDHVYKNDDVRDGIDEFSGIRVFYTNEVSELVEDSENQILGYDGRWADFQMYDGPDLNTENELEFDGSFRLFYRGVRDPLDSESEIRFNLDTVALNSRLSDQVSDDNDDDSEYSNVDIRAFSTNPEDFYPNQLFTDFEGFFTPNSHPELQSGQVESNLVSYEIGSETVSGTAVHYLDVLVPLATSYRYRAYETQAREDEFDLDNDGDRDELIDSYDLEVCELEETEGVWAVTSCEPKNRIYEAMVFSTVLQEIWTSGVTSRIDIDGRGTYFIEWPASTTDSNSCLLLDELDSTGSLDGTLYDPLVLGLNSLSFSTEVVLPDQPKTLLDVLINAPTLDNYQITAALSHDYSGTTESTVTQGTGGELDRVVLSYEADANLTMSGSLAIHQEGVELSLDDGTTDTVDSTLTLFLSESTGADPLPYQYLVNEDGDYELCVLANQAEWEESFDLQAATFYLNYRDVVYGRIQQENGTWVIRYIDGTFETLQ